MHKTAPVRVIADIDRGIATEVRWLNKIPGVRTFSSCQGGKTYRAYVMAFVPRRWRKLIGQRFEFGESGINWVYLHPR